MRRRIIISYEELVRRYIEEGQTQAMIAAAFGCSIATVSNLMRHLSIPIRSGRKQKRPIPYEQLVQLYSVEGVAVKEIAARFGVVPGTINNRRKEYGIPRRPRTRFRSPPPSAEF